MEQEQMTNDPEKREKSKFRLRITKKRIILAILVPILIISSIVIMASMLSKPVVAEEMYKKVVCPCCGAPISKKCCGMAKQRMAYIDGLIEQGLSEDEIHIEIAKNYGIEAFLDKELQNQIMEDMKKNAPRKAPKIVIEPIKYNFGDVSQSKGIVSTIFEISNEGKSDLIINNMDTSCMCTTASVIIDANEGPVFGMAMHGNNPKGWSVTIPPGENAQLKVYYDPNKHGELRGPITRFVTIMSNDPVNFRTKVRIDLNQVP